MTYIIAVDLGTTLIKCTLFDEAGRTVSAQSMPSQLEYPAAQHVEQDAALWYEGVCEAICALTVPFDKQEIRGICIASQGITAVPVGSMLAPLSNALSWLDQRAQTQCAQMQQLLSEEEWFARTGKFLSSGYTLPKLLWLRQRESEHAQQTVQYLMPMDYVNACMTGNVVTDHTMASGTMCYDVGKGDWSDEILSLTGLRREQLPTICEAGSFVGCLNEQTAQKTGLTTQTQVFCGGQDQKVAAYAAGISQSRASLSLGTAGALEIFVTDAHAQHFLPFFPYVMPGQTLVEGCVNTTGAAIKWMKETVFSDVSYDQMNRLAEAAPIGAGGLRMYPHMAKPGTPHRGLEEDGSLLGLTLSTGRGELVRALYEGLACEIRLNLEYAVSAGSKLTELVVFGGASQSQTFCQIIADVTNLRVSVTENSEMCSVGAAKLAAKGLGLNLELFARGAAGIASVYTPHNAAQYEALYQEYLKHYKK